VGAPYPFAPGQAFNLDGNGIITRMEPIAGAHGDIAHPEIGWAVLVAAGLAG
jgi:hypothetical protein